jgi:putative flippase GtrA
MYPPIVKPKKTGSVAWVLFKFGFVGGLGLFLNIYLMYLLMTFSLLTNLLTRIPFLGGSFYVFDAIVSSQAVILVSFLMNEGLVFRGRKGIGGLLRRMTLFNALSSADLVLRIPLLLAFTSFLGVPALLSNLDSILLTFAGRFMISHKKIWPKQA